MDFQDDYGLKGDDDEDMEDDEEDESGEEEASGDEMKE